jgi:hypothetical protein
MGEMSPVRTHEVAILTKDKKSVELVRIHKGACECAHKVRKPCIMAAVVKTVPEGR